MNKVKIKVGDRVGYRVAFLRSIGMKHGEIGCAKGTVTAMEPFGVGTFLASIKWDNADLPGKVLDQNLARVGSMAYTSEDYDPTFRPMYGGVK